MSAELSQKVPVISFIPNTVVLMLAFRCKVGLRDIDSDITTTTFRAALHDSKVAGTATTSNVNSNVMCERLRRLLHLVIQLCQLPLWKSRMNAAFSQVSGCKFSKTVTVNKDNTSSVSGKLVEVCRCCIINNKHSLLK